jgi:LacI family transcriptional regulator
MQIMADIQRTARKHAVETIFESPGDKPEPPLMIQNRTADGVIILGRGTPHMLEGLHLFPAIAIGNVITDDRIPRLVMENFRGMGLITDHLISLGHTKILFLSAEDENETNDRESHRERQQGYLSVMRLRGLTPEIVRCNVAELSSLAEKLVRQTAVITSCQELAQSVQLLLQKKGKALPRDCSLASFDGFFAEECGITTYVPRRELMAKTVIDLMIESPNVFRGSGIKIVVPGHLVQRQSTQPMAGRF